MHLNDHPTSVSVKPASAAPSNPGWCNHALPGTTDIPTVVTADVLNTIMAELKNAVEGAGLTLDSTNDAQLLAAMLSLADSSGAVGSVKPYGMQLAPTPSFTTTRVTIAAGFTRDSTNTARIVFGAPLIKRLDQAWAAGGGNGGRDTGSLANGQTWHVFAILKPTTGDIDALFSQSATAPTLPAGFTKFRRLGSILLDPAATTIRPFKQAGDEFYLVPRSADYAAQANGAGTPTLRSVSVPVGIKVNANFMFQSTGTANTTAYWSGLFDPDDGVPPAWGVPTQYGAIRRGGVMDATSTAVSYATVTARCLTDTTGKIYTFSSDSADVIALGVVSWTDFTR